MANSYSVKMKRKKVEEGKSATRDLDLDNGKDKGVDGIRCSYRDSVFGRKLCTDDLADVNDIKDDGDVLDDDVIEEGDGKTWFRMGMMKEEKIATRRLWRNSLIIKLVSRTIGYHNLCRLIQAMWRKNNGAFSCLSQQ